MLSYICIMENMKLLDLDNDVLKTIGDYVKKDNLDRISNETLKQDILEYVDIKMKIERKKARKTKKSILSKIDTRCYFIWTCFTGFCSNHLEMNFCVMMIILIKFIKILVNINKN
jgi:hypothetical protein